MEDNNRSKRKHATLGLLPYSKAGITVHQQRLMHREKGSIDWKVTDPGARGGSRLSNNEGHRVHPGFKTAFYMTAAAFFPCNPED